MELVDIQDNTMRLNLHQGQHRAWESEKRFVTVLAGTQGGKCVMLGSKILLSDGSQRRIETIRPGDQVLSLGQDLRITTNVVTASFSTGYQSVIRVTTATGRAITITHEHPLLSTMGWTSAGRLLVGDLIGVPYRYPLLGRQHTPPATMRLLGYLLGTQSLTVTCPVFHNISPTLVSNIRNCLPLGYDLYPIAPKRHDYRISSIAGAKTNTNLNPVTSLCHEWGIWGKDAVDRCIPKEIFRLCNGDIALLLAALFDADGVVTTSSVELVIASQALASEIQHLLLRWGIISCISCLSVPFNTKQPYIWQLRIDGLDHLLAFRNHIGFDGQRASRLEALLKIQSQKQLPHSPELSPCEEYHGDPPDLVPQSQWYNATGCDIYWDSISAIDPLGEQPVWDITVAEGHNFICNDIFAHNTSFTPHWLYREIQRCGPGDYLFVTPTFPLLELKALPEFKRVFEGWLRLGTYRGNPSRQFIFSEDGFYRTFGRKFNSGADPQTRVLFGYAADPESLESATAKAAVLDEAGQNKFKLGSWEAVLRRLSLARGRVLITTTPYNLGWLKREIFDKWKKGDPDIDVIQFESIMNPAFSREEFEEAQRRLPGWKFNMFYRGLFERPAGMIYDCFDEQHHLVPRFAIPSHWKRYMGVDFGGVNTAAVYLAQEPNTSRYYLYRTYKAGGRTAQGHVEAMLEGERMPEQIVGGALSENQWRSEFQAAGLPVRGPDQGEVEIGIDRVYGMLSNNELFIFDDVSDLRDELLTYSRVLDDNQQPTEQIEDKATYHLLDALRYIGGWLRQSHQGQTVQIALVRGLYPRNVR